MRTQKRDELGLSNDALLVLTVGRVATQKGHTYLLDAIPKVKQAVPQAAFFIAGDGHLRAELEGKAVDVCLGEALTFLGNRADVPELLAAADIFVLSSLWEGLPLALLEAMYMGLPVVSTQVEGVVDVVIEGETGYLVPVADADALADAFVKLLQDENGRQRLGAAGKKLVENNYTDDKMCLLYEQIFIQIGEVLGELIIQ